MKTELDRYDIINLLYSCSPNYETVEKIPYDLGHIETGICDLWRWESKDKINQSFYTDEELYNFYIICKDARLNFCRKYGINEYE